MATVTAIRNKTQSKTAMRKVVEYVTQEAKTLWAQDGQSVHLISGKDCMGDTALREFLSTKRQYRKETGRWFYQYVQSFKPGENATLQEIHQMGLELAEAFQGYEVLVATHIDNDHWHNHLIVNSVSHQTGLKLQFNEQDLHRLRDRSDAICKSHGLETLEPYQKPGSAGLRTGEYRAALKGDSWKFRLMADIDTAMEGTASKTAFIARMEHLGYSLRWEPGHKYITYTTPEGKKCRDNKLHEDKYLKANMEEYFEHHERTQTEERPAIGQAAAPDRVHPATGAAEQAGKPVVGHPSIREQIAHFQAVGKARQKAAGRAGKGEPAHQPGEAGRHPDRGGHSQPDFDYPLVPTVKKPTDRDDR